MEPDGDHKLVTHTFTHGMAFLAIGLRQKTLTQLDSSHNRIRVCLSHCPDQS